MMSPEDRILLDRAVARMRSRIVAVSCAVISGSALMITTVLHLGRERAPSTLDIALLSNYLPGYSVSWFGALLGLFYGVLLGAFFGGAFAWFYNRLAMREPAS